jgi:peroxiredoxin
VPYTPPVLKIGDIAPDIDAVTTTGARFVLSEQTAICTVVYFFPKAFTPGCTKETKAFSDDYNEIALAGASILGVSTDTAETQCEFAQSMRAPFPLVGDSDKHIAKAFDVLWPLVGVAKRATFVIGADRKILAVFHHEMNVAKHRDDVLTFVHTYCDAVRTQSQGLWDEELRSRT